MKTLLLFKDLTDLTKVQSVHMYHAILLEVNWSCDPLLSSDISYSIYMSKKTLYMIHFIWMWSEKPPHVSFSDISEVFWQISCCSTYIGVIAFQGLMETQQLLVDRIVQKLLSGLKWKLVDVCSTGHRRTH